MLKTKLKTTANFDIAVACNFGLSNKRGEWSCNKADRPYPVNMSFFIRCFSRKQISFSPTNLYEISSWWCFWSETGAWWNWNELHLYLCDSSVTRIIHIDETIGVQEAGDCESSAARWDQTLEFAIKIVRNSTSRQTVGHVLNRVLRWWLEGKEWQNWARRGERIEARGSR